MKVGPLGPHEMVGGRLPAGTCSVRLEGGHRGRAGSPESGGNAIGSVGSCLRFERKIRVEPMEAMMMMVMTMRAKAVKVGEGRENLIKQLLLLFPVYLLLNGVLFGKSQ